MANNKKWVNIGIAEPAGKEEKKSIMSSQNFCIHEALKNWLSIHWVKLEKS
jgi:hypothetical protein